MTKTDLAVKPTAADFTPPAKPIEVDPLHTEQQAAGPTLRTVFVRLPEGATADALKEPGLWRRLQAAGGKKVLRRLD